MQSGASTCTNACIRLHAPQAVHFVYYFGLDGLAQFNFSLFAVSLVSNNPYGRFANTFSLGHDPTYCRLLDSFSE